MLSDPFRTVVGRRYKLTMRIGTYEVKESSGDPAVSSGPVAIRVITGGKYSGRLDHPGGDPGALTVWVTRSLVFTATGPNTQVSIHGWYPLDLIAQRGKMGKAGIGSPTLIGLDFVSVRLLSRFPLPWQWPAV